VIGLDTNVLLRAITRDDAAQSPKARVLIASLTSSKPGYVNALVLAEMAWTLSRRYGYSASEIAAMIGTMLASDAFVIGDHDAVGRAVIRVIDDALDFSDALIGELNATARCKSTVTFDQKAARSSAFSLVP
jgi:predicted nucleic-acid-binding protein